MLLNNVISKRSFSQLNKRVVIMANSNSADVDASKFMKALKNVSGHNDFEFFGHGGNRVMDAGLRESTIDVDNFSDKVFYTWRKTKNLTPNHSTMKWSSWNFINAHYKKNADAILDLMYEHGVDKSIYKFRPSAILSFDNEYFTVEMMRRLNRDFKNSSVPMPSRHYYDRFIKDFRREHEQYFDHMHFTIPSRTDLASEYKFPGQFVGQHGVYETIKHIMSSDPEQKHLVAENSLQLNKKWFAGDLDLSIQKIRNSFREKHKIDDDATVIFFAPGNEKNEANFWMESARRGVEEFLLKYSSPTSLSPVAKPLEKFHTFISIEEGSNAEEHIRTALEERGWTGSYTIVTKNNNEYIDAMAASDLGIIYDGQMIGQAAAAHLPTMILLDMRMHHQYYHDMFNRWFNSMVTIADKDIYPELIGGQAWFGKIWDTLGEWYLQPGIRYDMVREWEGWLKNSMNISEGMPTENKSSLNQIIIHDGKEYSEYHDTFHVMAKKVWEDIQAYDSPFEGNYEVEARKLRKSIPNIN